MGDPAKSSRVSTVKRLTGAALGGLAVGVVAVAEVRNRRALAADDEWARLCSPLSGRGAQVTSRDGTLIHLETLGNDGEAPTFVLAPGWTEETLLWGPVARALVQRGFRVVVYDLRGQGASGLAPAGDYTLARYGEDLEAVLVAASGRGGHEPILAGHSLGGMSVVAWAVAHQPRSRVRAAALINTAVAGVISESGVPVRGVPAAFKHWLGVHVVLDEPLPRLPVSTAPNRALLRSWAFGPHATDAQVALLERMQWSCPTAVRTAAGRSIAGMDLSWAVPALTVPTMVIAGELDLLLPPAHSERIAAALPELVDLVVLPEVGHMSPLEASDSLADALVRLASAATEPSPNPASGQPD
jgi:pimeloyl-ACP methyl ester carboxylesterase